MRKSTIINGIIVKGNTIQHLPANPELSGHARKNRKAGNMAEVVFWLQVHRRMFHGLDFDRQKVIGNYIVDFYAKSLGLVVEIDGGSHNQKLDYDAQRDEYLEGLGLKVFRTTDYDVLQHVDLVLEDLELFIVKHYGNEKNP
ncbi:MAG: endonuclease domain-containing protein [Bacteroidales bacterium]|nr:endonuclease domain-containing protein [Bacteroidales bacterium]